MSNTTQYNTEYHAKYHDGATTGLRCPVDDRGLLSEGDRPVALFSNDPAWELGSINRVVKYMNDYIGKPVRAEDLADYNAGTMDISVARRYVDRSLLYGRDGDARDRTPNDLMSFRGYPTPEISAIEWETMELNQDTAFTVGTGTEDLTGMSDQWSNQLLIPNGTTLPYTAGSDYVVLLGKVTLSRALPFDKIWVDVMQSIAIENALAGWDPMYTGGKYDQDFGIPTPCYNSGDDTTFYFRFYAEISDAVLDDGNKDPQEIGIDLEVHYVDAPDDDALYVLSEFQHNRFNYIDATWNGTRWVGQMEVEYDLVPPSIPQNLALVSQSNGFATFSWDESTDEFGIRGYYLNYKKSSEQFYNADYAETNGITIELLGSTEYDIAVQAVDRNGNRSDLSDVLTFTTEQLALQVFYMNPTGSSTPTNCADSTIVAHYTQNVDTLLSGGGGVVYSDSAGSTPFPGLYQYYKASRLQNWSDECLLVIDGVGNVVGFQDC